MLLGEPRDRSRGDRPIRDVRSRAVAVSRVCWWQPHIRLHAPHPHPHPRSRTRRLGSGTSHPHPAESLGFDSTHGIVLKVCTAHAIRPQSPAPVRQTSDGLLLSRCTKIRPPTSAEGGRLAGRARRITGQPDTPHPARPEARVLAAASHWASLAPCSHHKQRPGRHHLRPQRTAATRPPHHPPLPE